MSEEMKTESPANHTQSMAPVTIKRPSYVNAYAREFINAAKYFAKDQRLSNPDARIQQRTDAIITAGSGAAQKLMGLTQSESGGEITLNQDQASDFADALSSLIKASGAMARVAFAGTIHKKLTNEETVAFAYQPAFTGWKFLNPGIKENAGLFRELFPDHKDTDLIESLRKAGEDFFKNAGLPKMPRGNTFSPQSSWENLTNRCEEAANSLLEGRQFAFDESARRQRSPAVKMYF